MNSRKLRVASIVDTLDLRTGGPAKTVIDQNIFFNTVKKYNAKIIELDNTKNIDPNVKKDIKLISLNKDFFANLKFFGIHRYGLNIKLLFWLLKNKNKYDIFIIHGLWHFKNLLARLIIKKKYYVFLHGSLNPYEKKSFFKNIKKKIYWYFVERKNLIYSKGLLFTSAQEKVISNNTFVKTNNLKKILTDYAITIQKYNKSFDSNIFFKTYPFLKNKEYYLFLGRLDAKKGCDILIRSIHSLKNKFKSYLVIAGDYDNDIGKELKKLVSILDLEKRVYFCGHIDKNIKSGALVNSKAMVLCSHDENYGISLIESLAYQKPVLTTYKVATYKKILAYEAGYVSRDDTKSFAKILNKFENLNLKRRKEMSKNAFNCFNENFNFLNKKSFIPNFEEFNIIKKK
jgi:glycosyltransferase involved in cell wall biosynthesis